MFGDWNDPEAVLKAANYAQTQRENCLSHGKSLCFETVFSSPDKIDFLLRAKRAGFFIRFFFVGTESPAVNAGRIAKRVMEGGHDVPIPKIISRYSKSISQCSGIIRIVDRAYIYDNTQEFSDPQLLFRTVDGDIEKLYGPVPPWAQSIFQAANR